MNRFVLFLLLVASVGHRLCAQIRDGGIDPKNLGKGDWVYSMTDATNKLGGHVSSVTNENSLMLFYKSQGVRYMIVKAATGASLFNGCYGGPQFTGKLVSIAHTNGIWIFGYNRSYATNVAAEVAIVDYVFNQGADGFVWDAEAEWESGVLGAQGPSLAWQQCSTVRSNWPNKFLAHAPFPIISLHSSFPYEEFGFWCDAVMPQIYHFSSAGIKGSASAAINWSDVNWRSWQNSLASLPPGNSNGVVVYWTNAIKPIIPLRDVYGPIISGGVICEGTASAFPDKDVMEFMDYSTADPHAQTVGGYNGVNFWRTDLHGAGQWANIKAATSGNLTGVVNNIVIDDAKASVVGAWTAVRVFGATTTTPTYYGATGSDTNSFGTNYFSKTQGAGSAHVQFTPNVAVPGDYNVYQWHPYVTNASAGVPHLINYNGGAATVYANQQTNSGNWSLLGRFSFAAGTSGYVRVLDSFSDAGNVAIADGVKLVFVPTTSVPAAPGALMATAISTSQISLSWTDNATNETGYVVTRGTVSGGPYADVATLPINSTNYNNIGLAANTTYYYVVRATNFLGASPNSNQAAATTPGASAPPSISGPPQNLTVAAGQDATFTVVASGTQPLRYQWRFNEAGLAGETNNTYTRFNALTNHAGPYSVVVTNALGGVTSAPAALTVNYSLSVTTSPGGTVLKNPEQTTYAPASMVTLTASPSPGFGFLGWSGDASGTSNPLSVTMTTNKSITAAFWSSDLILDNPDPPVSFAGDWQTGTASVDKYGADYRFASTVAGGVSNATYRPFIAMAGYYDVFIWYPQGSNRATNAPWSIFFDNDNASVPVNQQINGGGWLRIGASLPFVQGTNGYVLLSNDTGYSGKVVLADAVRFLYVGALPPRITAQPQSQVVTQGEDATFTVTAAGTTPLSYQWRFNGADIADAAGSNYTRANAQPSDAGDYAVFVSNFAGSVTSVTATLTVTLPQPTQIQSVTMLPDSSVRLVISGESGVGYAIDGTSNLVDWQQVGSLVSTGSTFEFVDNSASNSFVRFYRTRR